MRARCRAKSRWVARRMKELEKQNGRLKKAVAELTLDKQILKDALAGNF